MPLLRDRLEKIMDKLNDCARELHELSGGTNEWNVKRELRELHIFGNHVAETAECIEGFFEDPNYADLVAQEVA